MNSHHRACRATVCTAVLSLTFATPALGQGHLASAALRGLGVQSTVTEHRFPVSGRSALEATSRLNVEGPMYLDGRRAHGLTSFEMAPIWRPQREAERCVTRRVRVHTQIAVYLPDWVGFEAAGRGDQVRWRDLARRIARHEYDHRDLTLQAAAGLALAIREAHAPTCPRLVRMVSGIIREAYRALGDAHAAVDGRRVAAR